MNKYITLTLIKLMRRDKLEIMNGLLDSQWLSRSEIRELQNRKLLKLLEHCKKNVPYYRSLENIDQVGSMNDMPKLPFLTKQVIRENIDDLKASNFSAERCRVNSTSGSSGDTLTFCSDAQNSTSLGILTRNNMWTGWELGDKQVMLWGSHFDIAKSKKILGRIKNEFIYKTLYLSSYDMTEENMLSYQRKINRYGPVLITAYPSGMYAFASFLEQKGLSIITPRGIICSGETLYEYQREKIEAVFGCKVFNRYGCREVANIAHECDAHSGLHVNAEHIIVEVVDKEGNICKPGELGELVVTDLDNYVFPFIRYKIGDIGIGSDQICGCGRGLPLLEKVEGRIFDIVVGVNGNHITGNFWTILLRTNINGVSKFQVIQEREDSLRIKLIVDGRYDKREEKKLLSEVYEKCGRDMKVHIELVDKIELTKSGKHKFVISKYSPFINKR